MQHKILQVAFTLGMAYAIDTDGMTLEALRTLEEIADLDWSEHEDEAESVDEDE